MKDAGQVAFEARFEDQPPRNCETWADLGPPVRRIWEKVEERVIAAHTAPAPGWRELGQDDPHGERYLCPREHIAGGHMTDDQAAFAIAMLDRRSLSFEGTLKIAVDRIRWLSRLVARWDAAIKVTVQDANSLRYELGRRQSRIDALERDLARHKAKADKHQALADRLNAWASNDADPDYFFGGDSDVFLAMQADCRDAAVALWSPPTKGESANA